MTRVTRGNGIKSEFILFTFFFFLIYISFHTKNHAPFFFRIPSKTIPLFTERYVVDRFYNCFSSSNCKISKALVYLLAKRMIINA